MDVKTVFKGDRVEMVATCNDCGEEVQMEVSRAGYNAWMSGGKLIQVAFPELSKNKREVLISGTCGACFDKLFAGMEEEEESTREDETDAERADREEEGEAEAADLRISDRGNPDGQDP